MRKLLLTAAAALTTVFVANAIQLSAAIDPVTLEGVTYDENGLVVPAGEAADYASTGVGLYYSVKGNNVKNFDMLAPVYVDKENSKVYFGKLIPNTPGYLVGDLDEATGEVTIQLPQVIEYYDMRELSEIFDYALVTSASLGERYEYEFQGQLVVDYRPVSDPEQNVIKFKLDDDGNWVGQFDFTPNGNIKPGNFTGNLPNLCLTVFNTYTNKPNTISNKLNQTWTATYKPSDKHAAVIPDGVEIDSNWLLNSKGGSPLYVGFGFDGNDVYMTGLNPQHAPDCVIKGTRDGDIFTFPNQYIGYNELNEAYMYMVAGKVVLGESAGSSVYLTNPLDADGKPYGAFSFKYNQDEHMFTAADPAISLAFVDNMDRPTVTIDQYTEPVITQVSETEFAAPVVNPKYAGYIDLMDSEGAIAFDWLIEPKNTNGALLDYRKMWVNIFVNDAKYVFYDDEYELGSDVVDLPLTAQEYNVFYIPEEKTLTVFMFSEGIKTLGIKAFYPDGADIYSSDLVTTDFASLADAFMQGKVIESVTYFDLQGRRLDRAAGVCVARTVFTDGTSATSKVVVR